MFNPALATNDKPLRVKVGKKVGNRIPLILSDDQQIKVSPKFLPNGIKEGDYLYVSLMDEDSFNSEKEGLAKALLKEMLGYDTKDKIKKD